METVCLDTNIMIWGVKGEASPGQESNIPKAEALLKNIAKDKNLEPCITSVVLAELLVKVPLEQHEAFKRKLSEAFQILPFDALAAKEFGAIWNKNVSDGVVKELKEGKRRSKHELKADCMILATAASRRVSCLYSHDRGIKKLGEGVVEVKDLPAVPPKILPLFPEESSVGS